MNALPFARMARGAAAAAALLAAAACGGAGESAPRQTLGDAPQAAQGAGDGPLMVVYKTPTCGCCRKWVDHVAAAGFRVEVHDTTQEALTQVKRSMGVSTSLESCHTARVGDYVIEGHVPADLVQKLLAEKPAVAGLAVPGMPMGSPGMEGPVKHEYDVLTFTREGQTSVYATR